MSAPRIHLASFATRIFLPRQWFLTKSAIANRVCDRATSWRMKDLIAAGFQERAPRISLESRGAGYWAWKPFIIEHHLQRIPDGDILLYCDVGRRNHFKLLDHPLDPLIDWMDARHQDVMPGVRIPWNGPMSMWTKRDAFVFTGMDTPEAHSATPIQASFSLWRASNASRQFVTQWMDWCAQPHLVNDEKGACGLAELPDFIDHRHDQSLLTLCCLQYDIEGLDLGNDLPPIDSQYPSEVSDWLFPEAQCRKSLAGYLVKALVWLPQTIELNLRRLIPVGKQGPRIPVFSNSSSNTHIPS